MKAKRTKPARKKAKRRAPAKRTAASRRVELAPVAFVPAAVVAPFTARSRNRVHNVTVLIAAVLALAVAAGFAAWPRLSNRSEAPVARIDDATFAREIRRAVAEGGISEIVTLSFPAPAPIAAAEPARVETRIDPGIAARAEATAKAAAAKSRNEQKAREKAERQRARQNAARQARQSRAGNGLEAMAAVSTNELIVEARKYLGGNPTGWTSRWCGKFLDMILRKTGHKGGGNLARGYINYGKRLAGPQVGAIAVFTRKGGGHVGIVTGIDTNGNPIVISGNHNDRVAIATYPAARALAYVTP